MAEICDTGKPVNPSLLDLLANGSTEHACHDRLKKVYLEGLQFQPPLMLVPLLAVSSHP
jgi:hypothetical protein